CKLNRATCSYTIRNIVVLLRHSPRITRYFCPSQTRFICRRQRSSVQRMSCTTGCAVPATKNHN
ncbi:MAG: hypothetical protein IKM72_14490, partial [Oscillospiraceae bacterium]|nr:hypothetical protein [Oscillospiraceae bacterium]